MCICTALTGCNSSPLDPPHEPATAGDVARPVITTGLGAALGNEAGGQDGAVVGGLLGLGTGLAWNKVDEAGKQEAYREGYAQGAREKEADMLQDIWEAEYESGESEAAAYPNGTYEGVERTPIGSPEFPDYTSQSR